METKRDFLKAVAERRKTVKDNKSNCVGTALYLIGETEEDKFTFTWEGKGLFLKNLKESPSPELGYLIGWDSQEEGLYHLAVIVKKDPLMLATRNDAYVPFNKSENFEKTNHKYGGKGISIKFYIPSKLQKILDTEEQTK